LWFEGLKSLSLGSLRHRWRYSIKMDMKQIVEKSMGWIHTAAVESSGEGS
jgi:hypothetical protein